MTAIRVERRPVERIWGRRELPHGFCGCVGGEPVGEVWFGDDAPAALLVKYLFTSERLSVQVHPDDGAARARGHPHGKDEAWLVLDAEPGAVIGLGLKRKVSREELRAAALDGGIERLVEWRPVKAGDSFFSPAGTIHAIGPGLVLLEIQQNIDLTYRLYDYGRPRELHLDDAVAVAHPAPWSASRAAEENAPGRRTLARGDSFVVERWSFAGAHIVAAAGELWLVPLRASGELDGQSLAPGDVWRLDGRARLDTGEGVDLVAAYPARAAPDVVRASS